MHSIDRKTILKKSLLGLTLVSTTLVTTSALAAETFSFGEDRSLTVGMGFRGSMSNIEDGSASSTSHSTDFELDNLELRFAVSLSEHFKGIANIAKNADSDIEVLDMIAHFAFSPEFNIWAGRMLPPSDRSNLNGPFYLNAYSYPGIVAQYPSKFAGRDNGVTAWGKLMDKHLVYSAGIFEGHNNVSGASSEDDNLLYAGRLQYDFFSPDLAPAYLTASTFYGQDLLSVGLAWQYQKDGVGSVANAGDYFGWNLDVLYEKVINDYVLDLEGAYYRFDTDNTADVVPSLLASTPSDTANVGGIRQGKAYLASVGLLFPQKVGWGQFQPYVRYQKFEQDSALGDGASAPNVASGDTKQFDYGVNYIIDGHNARISAFYSDLQISDAKDRKAFVLGVQYQF